MVLATSFVYYKTKVVKKNVVENHNKNSKSLKGNYDEQMLKFLGIEGILEIISNEDVYLIIQSIK